MFRLFGTGKKLPGNKLTRWMLPIAVLAAVWPGAAQARPRFRDSLEATRVRLSLSLGMIDYSSFSSASNGRTQFQSYPLLGESFELEKFIRPPTKYWPNVGLFAQGERYPVRLFGRVIQQSNTSAGASWRLFTNPNSNWNRPEITLRVTANVQVIPDVRGYGNTTSFDLLQPELIGERTELRFGAYLNRHRKWRINLGGHYILPLSISHSYGATLDRAVTRSFGADGWMEYNWKEKVDLGVGFLYQSNRLLYIPASSSSPQQIDWINVAPQLSIQFWF